MIPEKELLGIAEMAYHGRVVSVSITEQQKEFGDLPDSSLFQVGENRFGQLRLMSNSVGKEIVLKVDETLKGPAKSEVKVNVSSCNGGQVGFLDSSTLYLIDEEWIIRPDLEYELRIE